MKSLAFEQVGTRCVIAYQVRKRVKLSTSNVIVATHGSDSRHQQSQMNQSIIIPQKQSHRYKIPTEHKNKSDHNGRHTNSQVVMQPHAPRRSVLICLFIQY